MLPGMNLLSYKLTTGELELNTTTQRIISSIEVGIGESVIAVLAGPPQGGTVGVTMFSKTTGEYVCQFPEWGSGISSGIPMAGDIISIGNGVLGNASDCTNLGIAFSGTVSLHGDSLYAWDPTTMKLSQYNDLGTKVWSSRLPAASDLAGKFFAVTSTAFNPDAVIINNRGTFTAVNKTTGSVLWNTSVVVPFGPLNSNGQEVYPLGQHNLFVRNLQGFVILDTRQGGSVKAVDETTPMTAVFSFMGAVKPFVVFGDLITGALKAVVMA